MLLLWCIGLFFSCGIEEFEYKYRKLDGDMIRPFSYRFANPELSPGDTAELSVIFSGKKISLDDISWNVCWNIYTDRYGNMAPRDERPLKIIGNLLLTDTDDGHSQTVTLKFKVPDSVLYDSDVIPQNLNEMAAMYGIKIPGTDFPMGKADVLQWFEKLAEYPAMQKSFTFEQGAVINGLSQVFSLLFEVYVDFPRTVSSAERAKIRNTVRYHNKLSGVKGIYINENPEIMDIKVFAMNEKDASVFNKSNSEEIFGSGDTVNIPVNRNKTIFMEIYASPKDSLLTVEQAFSARNVNVEQYEMRLFIEGGETYKKLSFSSQTPVGGHPDGYNIRKINIDYDRAKIGDTGYVFLVLFDDKIDATYYPQGRATKGLPIKFVE